MAGQLTEHAGAEDQETETTLRRRVGRGVAWATATNVMMRFASVAVTAVLARLLSKDDFGTFAVALAVYLVVSSLAELGMGSAVARSTEEPDDIAPTVATISVGFGAVLSVAMALGATQLASWLGQPAAAEPIRVLSISLFLTGVFAVPGAQLVRELRQDRIFWATLVGFLVANPVLVLMALNGGDATSFAWSRLIGQLATGLVIVAALRRRYRPGWSRSVVPGLLGFGIPLCLANLVNYSLLNADYLILGRQLPAAEIGVYLIAFNVANWSTAILSSVLNTVVVPTFGRLIHDPPRLGGALVSSTQLVALVALPIGALTLTLADPLVTTVFGRPWSEAAPVLAVLAVYGVLYSFTLLCANVLVAVGATTRLLLIQVAWVIVLVPGMILGLRVDGLVGAAWAHVVTVSVIALPAYLWMALRATGQRPAAIASAVVRPVAGALMAGVTAWVTSSLLGPAALRLVGGGIAGGIVYLVVAAPVLMQFLPRGARSRVAGVLAGNRSHRARAS